MVTDYDRFSLKWLGQRRFQKCQTQCMAFIVLMRTEPFVLVFTDPEVIHPGIDELVISNVGEQRGEKQPYVALFYYLVI